MSKSRAFEQISSGEQVLGPRARGSAYLQLLEGESEVQSAPAPSPNQASAVAYSFTKLTKDDRQGDDRAASEPPGKKKKRVVVEGVVVVDPKAAALPSVDGEVKINLSKFILRRLSADEVAHLKLRGEDVTVDHYVCTLHGRGASKSGHAKYVKAGDGNTGNLTKHCETYHSQTLKALKNLVREHPADEAVDLIKKHLAGCAAPDGPMDRFLSHANRAEKNGVDISLEARFLMWFLDGNIAFDQLDNSLFKEIGRAINVKMGSATTIVASLLPALYSFATSEMVGFLKSCPSFFVSFDGWSRFDRKFVSQHYHCIDPRSFVFHALPLDFIPISGPSFSKTIAGLLKERQDQWTRGSHVLAAGGIADGGKNMQRAGKDLFGDDDMSICQNHRLKKVFEGWEGRFLVVKRAVELKQSLQQSQVGGTAVVEEIRRDVIDFLSDVYFGRLEKYLLLLHEMNNVSLLYQTQRFPVGCFVPVCIKHLLDFSEPSRYDAAFYADMKTSFNSAMKELLLPFLLSCNNFLKAGLLHPGVAATMLSFIQKDVIQACFESIVSDALTLVQDASRMAPTKKIVEVGLEVYRDALKETAMPKVSAFPWYDVKTTGLFNETTHLDFWKKHVGDQFLQVLCPVAAMLLAMPAGEAIDECAFSSSQRTLSKDRSTMSDRTLEYVTVTRLFMKTFSVSVQRLDIFLCDLRKAEEKEKEERSIQRF